MQLIDIIDNNKMCEGCGDSKNYEWLNNDLILYKPRDGENAVFVENGKIRSTNCPIFLSSKDSMCIACKKSHHYLRT